MIYYIDNTDVFFKVKNQEVADEIDSLIVMANMLEKDIKYNSVDRNNYGIIINQKLILMFAVSPTGHASRLILFNGYQHVGEYTYDYIIDGVKVMKELLLKEA